MALVEPVYNKLGQSKLEILVLPRFSIPYAYDATKYSMLKLKAVNAEC